MKEQLELKPQNERKGGTSASNSQADLLCEGRHLAQQGLTDEPGQWSEFGTKIHSALNQGNPEGLDPQQRNIYDSCQEIESALLQQVFGQDSAKARAMREQRLWCKIKDAASETRFDHSAKPDVIYRVGPVLLICEYKSLPGELQSSPTNLQLRDQAVLAARNLIGSEVFTAVIQPLATHSPELCRYDKDSIDQAELEMFARVRRSNHPDAKRTPGEVQCKFCKARTHCQPYLDWAAAALPIPKADSPFLVSFQQWTPEQRSFAADRLPVMRKLLDEAESFLKRQLETDAKSVPGFYLKPGSFRSSITNPEELFTRYLNTGGTLDQFMRCVKITKQELEIIVREATKKKGKALALEMEKLLEGITEQKQYAPSLVRSKE